MKVITFSSFKGGSGKSTALMAMASSLVASGRKIALFEADENAPLISWRRDGLELGTWTDDACTIFASTDVGSFQNALTEAEKDDCEFALVDTQGGGSEFNNAILINSDVVIIPTALTPIDMETCVETLEYTTNLFMAEGEVIPTAILLQRIPTSRLTVSQKSDLAMLDALPQVETKLHYRDAFGAIRGRGMIHLLLEKIAADPMQRLVAGSIRTAAEEADAMTADILAAIGE